MSETLKAFFSPALVRRLAGELQRVHAEFPSRAFVRDATRGLEKYELLDRGRHIAAALAAHLPESYPDAIDVLLRSLGAKYATDEVLGSGQGMAPFFYLPHTLFVAERGIEHVEHFDLSLHAQYELTKRFSAESSMRAYIARDPERTFKVLERWVRDEDAHVRRLVSECTRLRLPWASRVKWLDHNPERVLALLEKLKDDPASYVRRSVANNLNDLGKLRPELLLDTCARWLPDASPERRALIEHALRSAVKRGDPQVLKLLGFGTAAQVAIEDVRFEPKRVAIGDRVRIHFTLCSRGRREQALLVDVAVHFVKANGGTSPKVFKLKRILLAAGGREVLKLGVSLAVHTTRKPRVGKHRVEVLINGVAREIGAFTVVAGRA